jgi:hypothetical protein
MSSYLTLPTALIGSCLAPLLAQLSAPLMAAEFEDQSKLVSFYGSFGVTVAPDVEEDTSGSGGSSHYVWSDPEASTGQRVAVGHLIGKGNQSGGWAFGIELASSTTDITPRTYDVGGLSFNNTSSRTLRYTTAGALVYGGYQYGINNVPEEVSVFFFLTPFLGGGAAWADSEIRDSVGTYAGERGVGYYIEGGLRFGFAITEKHWLLGVMVDGVVGTSTVNVEFGSGQTSELTLERGGVGGAFFVGYRL